MTTKLLERKTWKVRTPVKRPHGYFCEVRHGGRCDCEYDREHPRRLVIGGRKVERLGYSMRAVYPVNDDVVVKVQCLDECDDWVSDQNLAECQAWEVLKHTPWAPFIAATWGYATFEDADGNAYSYCFQERLHGRSLPVYGFDNENYEISRESFEYFKRKLKNKYAMADLSPRQAMTLDWDTSKWKLHDYAGFDGLCLGCDRYRSDCECEDCEHGCW